MSTLVCTIFFVFIVVTDADSHDYRYFHPGTVMMGGYYGVPPFKTPNIPLENNNPLPAENEEKFVHEKESVTEDAIIVSDEDRNIREHSTVPQNIDRVSKTKETVDTKEVISKKKNSKPEDEVSVGSNFPFGSGGSSFFNTLFPVMVGGNSGVRRKSGEDDGSFGGATAIANSFSTGRGGVASSHATSFGDVYLSSASRNRNERIKENI